MHQLDRVLIRQSVYGEKSKFCPALFDARKPTEGSCTDDCLPPVPSQSVITQRSHWICHSGE